jgi:uncharacterized membrane protein
MPVRRTMKNLAKLVLLAVGIFFLVATGRFIELLLTNLTYHPWLTSMVLIALLAMVIWLLRGAYNDEPDPRRVEP